MAKAIIMGSDLLKGFKTNNNPYGLTTKDLSAFQMMSETDKNENWIKFVADTYEQIGWKNVDAKKFKLEKFENLADGTLNISDYIVGPSYEDYYRAAGLQYELGDTSPIRQFYPIIPNIIDLFEGERLRRDVRMSIQTIDSHSVNEKFAFKEEQYQNILLEHSMLKYRAKLLSSGLIPQNEEELQKIQQQLSLFANRFKEVDFKIKTYKSKAEEWAERIIKVHEQRYNLQEIENLNWRKYLSVGEAYFHIKMMEDDFKVEIIPAKYADWDQSENKVYASQCNYFLWFEYMSAADIMDNFRTEISEKDYEKLKNFYINTTSLIIPDSQKIFPGAYWDHSKSYNDNIYSSRVKNDVQAGEQLAFNIPQGNNFQHNFDEDMFSIKKQYNGEPPMFRIMYLYWKSNKKIGWLVKKDRDGNIIYNDWVSEDFIVTEKPVYDKSIIKEEKKENLLYGEHIDWTWVPDFRYVKKISPNMSHPSWNVMQNDFAPIYIGGNSLNFQYRNRNSQYGCTPPIEGIVEKNSITKRLRSKQIMYNIIMNKVPKNILEDFGVKLGIHKAYKNNSNGSILTDEDSDILFEQKLAESSVFDWSIDPETQKYMGQPPAPQVLNLSNAQETMLYLQMGNIIKESAGEDVGVTRQRLSAQKASETAYSVEQGINYSETQTERHFSNFNNLMERFRQKMLEASQYYSTFSEKFRTTYMNDFEENVLIEIEGMDNLFTEYLLRIVSSPADKKLLQDLKNFLYQENTLPIRGTEKIKALISDSKVKILKAFEEGEARADELQEQQKQFEESQLEKQLMAQKEVEQNKLAFEADQNQLDRNSQEYIAKIKALGGIQTDNDKDGQLDATENFSLLLKQKEFDEKFRINSIEQEFKKQTHLDNLLLQKEKLNKEIEKEKIKGEYNLRVAKENKQKFDK